MDKRPINAEEEEKALLDNAKYWNACNPSYEITIPAWLAKLAEAKKEGYVSEICGCGIVFLAFHHFCNCTKNKCPFSDGVSMLERMQK